MRKFITAALLMGSTSFLQAQGTLVYDNNIAGGGGTSVVAPIYGPEFSDPSIVLQGNDASGFPVGTNVYSGTALSGAGFTAELWAALGADRLESELAAVTNSSVSFVAPGFIAAPATELEIPGVAQGEIATLQLRAWDNLGGTITNFTQAVAAGDVAWGVSLPFDSEALGNFPTVVGPNLVGLESFNIHVPEPGMLALGFTSLGMLLILRRQKR